MVIWVGKLEGCELITLKNKSNRDIFVDFFLIIAYNLGEQEHLLDLSANL